MTATTVLIWAVATVLLSWGLTGAIRRYAVSRSLLDVPNHRSSHQVPTPRGGGLAIVLASGLAWVLMPVLGLGVPMPWLAAAAAVFVAGIGWVDDHRHVPAVVRLLSHLSAAGVVVWTLGGLSPLLLAGFDLSVMPLGPVLGVLLVAWWINLTNFMDGIDGIAGVQVVSVCLGGAVVNAIAGGSTLLVLGPVGLAAATLGFLRWNWPPARIFMGDVGSGFVGAMLGVFTLQAGLIQPEVTWAWIILSATFVSDASVTLVARAIRGERLFDAHRSHTYQRLAQTRGHRAVTLSCLGINLLWLLPLAALVGLGRVDGWVGAAIGYLPLLLAAALSQRGTIWRAISHT